MQFLLASDYICVELLSVLSDRELLVIIERDVYLLMTDWLVFWIVKLLHKWVF